MDNYYPKSKVSDLEAGLAELRVEEEAEARREITRYRSVANHHQKHDEQCRHQELDRLFQSTGNPTRNHQHGHHHKHRMPEQQGFRVAQKTAKNTADTIRSNVGKRSRRGPENISQ